MFSLANSMAVGLSVDAALWSTMKYVKNFKMKILDIHGPQRSPEFSSSATMKLALLVLSEISDAFTFPGG